MKNFIQECKSNIRELAQEEPLDYYLFRPLAFCIVKLTLPLPLSPNHFSLMALISALLASFFLLSSHHFPLWPSALFILLFNLFDCCDGMVARLKGNGSKYGALIDMFVDLMANLSIYLSLSYYCFKTSYSLPLAFVPILTGFLILFHASFFYHYKKRYLCYLNNQLDGRESEKDFYIRELNSLKEEKGQVLNKFLIKFFLLFSSFENKPESNTFNRDLYIKFNRKMLPLWGICAGTSHLTLLALSLFTKNIFMYFYFSIIVFNFLLVLIYIAQKGVDRLTMNQPGALS